jgi:enoyl-CoA hydratase/carnithine racemase
MIATTTEEMAMSLVLRADADGVTTLTLNRPEKLNALTREMLVELRAHVDAIALDETVGCVIVRGAGRCFGAGHDLADTGRADEGPWRHFDAETIDQIEALPQPTIAGIHGYCFTGSLELALACDLLIAGESAVFADTHGTWGLVPVWGMSVRLPERVGVARAKELAFTCRRIDGQEAAAAGLVHRCVPDGELDRVVDDLARQVVASSWDTNRMTKALYRARPTMTRAAALAYERTRPFGLPRDREQRMQARHR